MATATGRSATARGRQVTTISQVTTPSDYYYVVRQPVRSLFIVIEMIFFLYTIPLADISQEL